VSLKNMFGACVQHMGELASFWKNIFLGTFRWTILRWGHLSTFWGTSWSETGMVVKYNTLVKVHTLWQHPLGIVSRVSPKNNAFPICVHFQENRNCQKTRLFSLLQPYINLWAKAVGPCNTRLYNPPDHVVERIVSKYIWGEAAARGGDLRLK
jgi:hypothetical protein